MSLYSLANGAAAAQTPAGAGAKANVLLQGIGQEPGAAVGGVAQATQALGALAAFVPTEIVAMYVAVAPLLGSLAVFTSDQAKSVAYTWWYVVCLILTVVFYYVVFVNQYRSAHNAYPTVKQVLSPYTTWRAVAAVIAYLIWALAVQSQASKLILCWTYPRCLQQSDVWMGILIFIVSPLLAALDGLFKPETT